MLRLLVFVCLHCFHGLGLPLDGTPLFYTRLLVLLRNATQLRALSNLAQGNLTQRKLACPKFWRKTTT